VIVLAGSVGEPPFRDATNPALAWVRDQWVAAWVELHDQPGLGSRFRLRFARLDGEGHLLGESVVVQDGGPPSVAPLPDGFAIGWGALRSDERPAGAWFVRFAQDGTPRGEPVAVADGRVGDGSHFVFAPARGGLAVAWAAPAAGDAGQGSGVDLFVREVGPDGTPQGPALTWHAPYGPQERMQLVPLGDGYGLAWFERDSGARCCEGDEPLRGRFVGVTCR
jgi:hypothetical protein